MRLYILSLNKYLADNRRHFLLCLAGLAALSVFMGVVYSINDVERPQLILLSTFFYLCIFACIRASLMFSSMKSARGRISTIMSPASTWNKFAARWTVNVPLTILALIGAFWLTENVRVMSWPLFHDGHTTEWFAMTYRPGWSLGVALIATGALAIQSFFCFGAIAWPRMSALKSVLVQWIYAFILGTVVSTVDFEYFFSINSQLVNQLLHAGVYVNIVITLVFWGLTYMRFNESEVVDSLF
ncbi:MAG: hypothetical protein HDR92_00575 [Bacteroides sp.]|nr:hypothetical protein [Bacteroides sp.]